MEFEEWKVKYYRPPAFDAEDECQDPVESRRLLRKDQEEKYAAWVALHEPKDVPKSDEEERVVEQLEKLRNPGKDVTLPELTPLRNNGKSRAEYMRKYRKMKRCRHCGELNP